MDVRETLAAMCQLHGLGTIAYAYDFHPGYLAMVRDGEVKAGPRLRRLLETPLDDGEVA